MTPFREFLLGVSLVVMGCAAAVRGLLIGDVFMTVWGLGLMALVFASELILDSVLSRRDGVRARHVAIATFNAFQRRRPRRIFVVLMGLFGVDCAARCVATAVNQDWGSCLYYGVAAAAIAVIAFVLATSPYEPNIDADEIEARLYDTSGE